MGLKTTLTASALALAIALPAAADDLDVIKSFYADMLTTPGDVTMDDVTAVVVEDWVSTPTPRGGPGAEGMFKTLQGFGAIIPDLTWEPEQIYQDGNTYIVRGRAKGTPVAPFFGIDPPTGNSFDIMSIDIHTVENGKIVRSYHIEEWAQAIQQLTAE